MVDLGFLSPVADSFTGNWLHTHHSPPQSHRSDHSSKPGAAGSVWRVLHQPGPIPLDGITIIVVYPLIPWIAVMAAGYCFGPVMSLEPRQRRAWMIRIGLGMILAFIALRFANIYGDPLPWSWEDSGKTWLSFLKCTKYPPSLDFLLMTLVS